MSYSTDPRAARSREAMLVAALRLLADEGLEAITHHRVAQQAGVGRATVYRHWPRTEQLLLDVMSGSELPLFAEPEAPVRAWLRRHLRQMADELAIPAVAAVSLTLMQSALSDSEVARRQDASLDTIADRLNAAIRLAVANGELETGAGPSDVPALLVGPLVYHTTMRRGVVSDDFIDRLIGTVGTWHG